MEVSAVNRLRSACGHLQAVVRMAEESEDCLGILHQLSAVQGALEQTRLSVLEHHVRECMSEAMASAPRAVVVDEFLTAVFGGPITERPEQK